MKTNTFYLGADVSKGYCDFVIINEAKQAVEQGFKLDDTVCGQEALKMVVQKLFSRYPRALLHAGIESTGGYENNWFQQFLNLSTSANLKVCRLNPEGVHHHKKASLTRNSTDKISARAIAEYLIDHPKNIIYNRQDPFISLRKEFKFIRMLTKQRGQLVNHLESALYTAHPQLLPHWEHSLPRWFLLLISKYSTAEKLAKATAKTVAKIPYVTLERAKELIKSAASSIGAEQDEVTELRIKSIARQILQLDKLLKEQTDFLIHAACIPGIDILTSFVGIGNYSAVGLMLIIGDINRFGSSSQLASYLGVHPVYKESGDDEGAYRMSKKGSKEARVILFNVARCAIVSNDLIRKLYEGYLERGKEKMAAIGMVMHKIVRVIYGMLKKQTKFDPEIDQKNRQKNVANGSSQKRIDKTRRFQQPDQAAPISRRQKKKRERSAAISDTGSNSKKNQRSP